MTNATPTLFPNLTLTRFAANLAAVTIGTLSAVRSSLLRRIGCCIAGPDFSHDEL
jgi:hypothetical protein